MPYSAFTLKTSEAHCLKVDPFDYVMAPASWLDEPSLFFLVCIFECLFNALIRLSPPPPPRAGSLWTRDWWKGAFVTLLFHAKVTLGFDRSRTVLYGPKGVEVRKIGFLRLSPLPTFFPAQTGAEGALLPYVLGGSDAEGPKSYIPLALGGGSLPNKQKNNWAQLRSNHVLIWKS